MRHQGIILKCFVMVMAIFAILSGIWLTFFHSKGFLETTATIGSIEEEPGIEINEVNYIVTVDYVVDGTHYTEVLDSYDPSYKEGKTIDVLYNPEDPTVVHAAGSGFGIFIIVIGVLLLGWVVFSHINWFY